MKLELTEGPKEIRGIQKTSAREIYVPEYCEFKGGLNYKHTLSAVRFIHGLPQKVQLTQLISTLIRSLGTPSPIPPPNADVIYKVFPNGSSVTESGN